MPTEPMSHPDRVAATLANLDAARADRRGAAFARPGAGAHDCRIDLKLLQWRALQACARSEHARARLAAWDREAHPDLWAGTVQDGTARGFAVALEEAIALAPPPPSAPTATFDPVHGQRFTGKDLRKKKDLLVASGGARVRFSRKEGLLFVDREGGAHSANCLRFEARADHGTLDGFAGAEGERPRLFSAQFLEPQHYVQQPGAAELLLRGRLGNGPIGWDCEVLLSGCSSEASVAMVVRIDNRQPGWRLRARFLGVPGAAIHHECTDVRETVQNDAGGFVAFTLVRACGTLQVDGVAVATPAGQCLTRLEHPFRLGGGASAR